MMNGLLIAVAVIFLVGMFWGYYKGFIKIIASLATTIATIVLVSFLTPYVSDMIMKVIPIETMMQEKCIEILFPESKENEEYTIPEEVESSRDTQISLIEQADMPDLFRQLLLENNNDEIYESLGVTKFSEYVGSYLARVLANILSFLLVLVVVTIAVRIITCTLGIIGNLPVIGGLNRLAGGILGIATGLIVVWILFVVITLLYNTEIGGLCFKYIEENKFLTELYNNNILMNFITKFRA